MKEIRFTTLRLCAYDGFMSSIDSRAPLMTPVAVRSRAKVLSREHRQMRAALVQLRRDAGLTQGDLAKLLDVSQQAISKFERYDSDPKMSTVRRYANAVGALIDHRVVRDHGQSIVLAATKSEWVPTPTVDVMPLGSAFPDRSRWTQASWSTGTAQTTDLALAL